MSLIAALFWNKSPNCAISYMIVDDENMQYVVKPTINRLPKKYASFKKSAKNTIKEFFIEVKNLHIKHKKPIIVEYKIVFHVPHLLNFTPAKESLFVQKQFIKYCKKTIKKSKSIKLKPQLRNRLSGKALKQFKKKLRSLYLVSRKKDTGFEYHLWTVALHATPATYAEKLLQVRKKLLKLMWKEEL